MYINKRCHNNGSFWKPEFKNQQQSINVWRILHFREHDVKVTFFSYWLLIDILVYNGQLTINLFNNWFYAIHKSKKIPKRYLLLFNSIRQTLLCNGWQIKCIIYLVFFAHAIAPAEAPGYLSPTMPVWSRHL